MQSYGREASLSLAPPILPKREGMVPLLFCPFFPRGSRKQSGVREVKDGPRQAFLADEELIESGNWAFGPDSPGLEAACLHYLVLSYLLVICQAHSLSLTSKHSASAGSTSYSSSDAWWQLQPRVPRGRCALRIPFGANLHRLHNVDPVCHRQPLTRQCAWHGPIEYR